MSTMTDVFRAVRRGMLRLKRRPAPCRVQVRCPKEYLGTVYGGYCVNPTRITPESVVYSFGVGDDVSFDLALIDRFGVHVHAFDPTPKSVRWVRSQALPNRFLFHEFGVAAFDGDALFSPPGKPQHVSYRLLQDGDSAEGAVLVQVHRLNTIMTMLGHDRVDVLKMDVEGAEYAVIEDIAAAGVDVGQLLVEFHYQHDDAWLSRTREAIRTLNERGLKVFEVSPTGQELSFIRA